MASLIKWGTKLVIVGGATVLVVNHEVFGANKYTKQIIGEVRRSLPDTAEAFDQMPTKHELTDALVNNWNSGVQTTFHWLVDAPTHAYKLFSSLSDKVKG
ncbi:unnamed protein product [Rotaria magnacalcarata]|uniref:MICOS complex subunit MIC13 n=1 Tax=Rotaria magnacalcarata TaxID=392030 RepID=A0A819AQN5_9BILA|nr:unnamed protein product [Rotaria magnacalcarata]CAF1550093.1 unnamed protein product [Rotaria magnacalcarata]CAF2063891.1 unnamed protein product [Rotaria magnacalcarata]CAF2074230.1 unnamed protein product [Rotaria magnacalcarata]CAF2102890.1 unnamed protein product [Rotaria magnacalcarata]